MSLWHLDVSAQVLFLPQTPWQHQAPPIIHRDLKASNILVGNWLSMLCLCSVQMTRCSDDQCIPIFIPTTCPLWMATPAATCDLAGAVALSRVMQVDANWACVLCDFGLTREQTQGSMTTCGTLSYCAPEV